MDARTEVRDFLASRGAKILIDLVGELSTRSDLFRTRWATHNVLASWAYQT